MKTILLTGFEPFGGEEVNPSFESLKGVSEMIGGVKIVKKKLPVVFNKAIDILDGFIKEFDPDDVVCFGQAGGRFHITPERVAINVDDGRIKDNEGYQPVDAVIKEDGEKAYFSTLPIKSMVKALNENGVPASVSNSAGTYVCNHVMYGLLYLLHKKYPNKRGGFIHVPYSSDQAVGKNPPVPYMTLDLMTKGIEIIVQNLVKTKGIP